MKKIIFDSDIYNYIDNYKKDLINNLIDNDIEPTPNNIEDLAISEINNNYIDIKNAFKSFDNNYKYDSVAIVGVLNLWNGTKKVKIKYNNLNAALININKYDNFIIYFDKKNGALSIDVYHHDGVNNFKFYIVVNGKKRAFTYDYLKMYL